MPNKELSTSMKHQFAEAMKKRLTYMSFDKITVTQLAKDCGVNRQTFYYHFEDIFSLMEWCLKHEVKNICFFENGAFQWKESMERLIDYISKNNALCVAVLNSMGHRRLKKILMEDIESLIREVIKNYNSEAELYSENAEFYIRFYALAVGELLECWILGEINLTTEKLIANIGYIIRKNIPQMIE